MKLVNTIFVKTFLIIFICCNFESCGQKKSPTPDWIRERTDRNEAEKSLPRNLMLMGPHLRDLIIRMKASGITRANPQRMNLQKKISTDAIHVDSCGRVIIEVTLRSLDSATIKQWINWDVKIDIMGYNEELVNPTIVYKLKSLGTSTQIQNSKKYIGIGCRVPFDVMEEFAKLPTIIQITALYPMPEHGPVFIDH